MSVGKPLYGMVVSSQSDGYYIMRMMMASNRATLMELGVSPIITSGMIMSLCMGAKIFDVDFKKPEDQNLVNVMQTTLGVLISLGSALTFVLGGQYGPVAVLGAVRCTMLVLQLVFAGIVVLLLDDLLGKGYGLGSGLNLFIVTNVCEGIVWACLSPLTITAGSASSTQFEGAFTHLFYVLVKDFSAKGLWDALTRGEHTNLLNVAATCAIFAGVVFVQGWTNETVYFAPEKYKEVNKQMEMQPLAPGQTAADRAKEMWPKPIPIKLFYTSNMPIMLLSALHYKNPLSR
jgi:protein transport protein SEC61 subunit alpha